MVNERELRELPNLTRNPYQFVALSGNVSDAGMGTRGAGVAINGQREASTNILLDGAANNDEFGGNIGQQIPLDAVQEFSVLTANFTAEYGRASGGIVNVVTKSGSNSFHGTAYEFNRVSGSLQIPFRRTLMGRRNPCSSGISLATQWADQSSKTSFLLQQHGMDPRPQRRDLSRLGSHSSANCRHGSECAGFLQRSGPASFEFL